jgi:hypothetical protein
LRSFWLSFAQRVALSQHVRRAVVKLCGQLHGSAVLLAFFLQHLVQFIQARQGQCGIIYARLR